MALRELAFLEPTQNGGDQCFTRNVSTQCLRKLFGQIKSDPVGHGFSINQGGSASKKTIRIRFCSGMKRVDARLSPSARLQRGYPGCIKTLRVESTDNPAERELFGGGTA